MVVSSHNERKIQYKRLFVNSFFSKLMYIFFFLIPSNCKEQHCNDFVIETWQWKTRNVISEHLILIFVIFPAFQDTFMLARFSLICELNWIFAALLFHFRKSNRNVIIIIILRDAFHINANKKLFVLLT